MRAFVCLFFFCCTLAVFAGTEGCKSFSERTLTDTEGRTFSAKCERSGVCTSTQAFGAKRSDGKSAQALLLTGHVMGICDVEPGQAPGAPSDCRALVCQSDADCPPNHGLKDGQCLNALCTDGAQPLDSTDSVMLCLAGSGLGRDQPRQVERFALGLNCGTPCKVPAPCRQP
ncbi:MAG TPA: hypothetical protein VNW92_29215 [Polyangiaceae bacterium]|jgi:hypothetical protein|nr:hypothetical protein [Polyangiaceae bacterium]